MTTEPKETSLARYDTPRGEIILSARAVRALCPKATPEEIALFVKVCLYHRLNPYLREVYLIKYDANAAASIVVGKDTFTQRAEADPAFDGFVAGIICSRPGERIERIGACPEDGDTLIGGWAEVYRKDRSRPFRVTVSMKEYNRGQSSWKSMPATMIRKVALVQALREAFPSLFAGLYDSAETEHADAIEGVGIPIAPETPSESTEESPPMGEAASSNASPQTPPTMPTAVASKSSEEQEAAPPSIPDFPDWPSASQWFYQRYKRVPPWQKLGTPGMTPNEKATLILREWGPPKEGAEV